jgi:hypothetical protein
MKKTTFLLSTALLAPSVLFAQPPEIQESIHVVRQKNRTALPAEACDWALPFLGGKELINSSRSDLYSIQTKKTNASTLKGDIKKVGSWLGCLADYTLEYERVDVQTADFGEIWQMTLNGKEYTVTGTNRLRTNPNLPPYGFPVPYTGMFLVTSTGTVHKSFADTWPAVVVVGSFSCNVLSDLAQTGSFEDLGTCTISLYE